MTVRRQRTSIKYSLGFLLTLVCTLSPLTIDAAPTDGRIFWSESDKHPDIVLSADRLSLTSAAPQYYQAGVRGNRPLRPGEGFYYFEFRTIRGSQFTAGVANSAAALNDLGGFDSNAAIVNHEGRVAYNGGFSGPLTNPDDTVGVAVDYRGVYPIVHFIGAEAGQAPLYLGRSEMTEVAGQDIFFFLALADIDGGGVEHRINLGGEPFAYAPGPLINGQIFRGAAGLNMGWPIDNASPSISLDDEKLVLLAGETFDIQARANDAESGDLSAQIQWWLDDNLIGSGATVSISPISGEHQLVARVQDEAELSAEANVQIVVTEDDSLDHDFDGLSYTQERVFGSNPAVFDSDHDGLNDFDEYQANTNPLHSDSDLDGMDDAYEVANALDPLANDAALDSDGDGFSNLTEFAAQRRAGDAQDFPGHGRVILNSADASANAVILSDETSFAVSANSAMGAARSDVGIAPQSGWHYFEVTRLAEVGNFGFGVATADADLLAPGDSAQSLAVFVSGELRYDSSVVDTLDHAENVESYGLAVDYSGTYPIAHLLFKRGNEDYTLLPAIELTGISEPLLISVFGESAHTNPLLQINAGEDKQNEPFHYPARYLLHRAGNASAEFLRPGWGDAHVYRPLLSVPLEDSVFFVKDSRVNEGLTLSEDKLGASYTAHQKSAVLANQGMIGEFRYFEAQRHIEVANIGFGLNGPYAYLDPYCCVNQGIAGAPPSMSINSVGGVWRNLQHQFNYSRTADTFYYGFAVDYRSDRPIVYVITADGVAGSVRLDDFITEIYPMIYANPQGPRLTNSANFGARPFFYNARQALQDYGVDTDDFVPGWGLYEQEETFGNVGPQITSYPPLNAEEDRLYTYQLSVLDPDDLDMVNELTFSLKNAPAGMSISAAGLIEWVPTRGTTSSGALTVSVADGGEFSSLPASQTFTISVAAAPTPTPTSTASPTPEPTATPVPTSTPAPTATPVATATPEPTSTPQPTPTVTPDPSPSPTPGDYIVLSGTPGDDGVYAHSNEAFQLIGLAGTDHLVGRAGDDLLNGGAGNDTLEGGAGADIYYYNLGDGSDYIANYDDSVSNGNRADRLVFGPDIIPNDIEISISGRDLIIHVEPTGDTITVGFHFYDWDGEFYSELSAIEYADGTVISASIIRVMLTSGTEADDTIEGFELGDILEGHGGNDAVFGLGGNDFVFGNDGDDTLFGGQGNDRMGGGPGDDFLQGDVGDDIYMYALGEGNDIINNFEDELTAYQRNDVIEFGAGISSSDVELSRDAGDLVITILPTGDTVTVAYHFYEIDGGLRAAISALQFSDGVIWHTDDIADIIETGIAANADNIVGTDDDDGLFGTDADNVLVGGLGDDWLFGDTGNDEYRYTYGDGNDTIANMFTNPQDINTLTLEAIDHSQIWFERSEVDLLIHIVGSGHSIKIYAWFNDPVVQLDRIDADGFSISREAINALTIDMSAYPAPEGEGATIPEDVAAALASAISSYWN